MESYVTGEGSRPDFLWLVQTGKGDKSRETGSESSPGQYPFVCSVSQKGPQVTEALKKPPGEGAGRSVSPRE